MRIDLWHPVLRHSLAEDLAIAQRLLLIRQILLVRVRALALVGLFALG